MSDKNTATKPTPPVRCSFCGKTQHEVGKLIAGPNDFICNECIGVCVDILADDGFAPGPGALDAALVAADETVRALRVAAHALVAEVEALGKKLDAARAQDIAERFVSRPKVETDK